jgi:hypothetical protein
MKSDINTLLTDIKAAARIGHAESLWVALDALLDHPEVAGNPQMSEAFINQVILPVGEALTHPRLSANLLRPLGNEPYAAMRAITAAAFAHRFFLNEDVRENDLKNLGKDPRKDVRSSLQLALVQAGKDDPEKLFPLIEAWLGERSPRLQAISLRLLPTQPDQAIELLRDFLIGSDPEIRAAAVDTLTELAQQDKPEEVLEQLAQWAKNTNDLVWVIGKTLSSSWAARYPDQALNILNTTGQKVGPHKQIHNTLQALTRHGAGDRVNAKLTEWLDGNDQNLKAIAVQEKKKRKT